MLSKDDFIKIGRIKKRIGRNNGEFIMYTSVNFDIFNILNDTLFLEINSCDLLPVYPESYSEQSPTSIKIKFDNINNDVNKDVYLNRDVYIHKSLIENADTEVANLDVSGWTIIDNKIGIIGSVIDIITTKQQTILIVKNNSTNSNDEIMIPFHEDLICDSCVADKTITFNLPDGLLNINNNHYDD